MLPSVHAQNRLHVNGTGSEALLVLGVSTHRASELVAEGRVGGVGGHVNGLTSGVGGWVGRTGVVCAEDLHQALALQVLSQPDKTGAEHGVGSGQEIHLQGLDGGAGVNDVLGELLGDLGGSGGLRAAETC